jgi:hypothetical protein
MDTKLKDLTKDSITMTNYVLYNNLDSSDGDGNLTKSMKISDEYYNKLIFNDIHKKQSYLIEETTNILVMKLNIVGKCLLSQVEIL